MTLYRIHRIKETPAEHFRWAPHTGGLAAVKLRDYEANGEIHAATTYAAWKALAESGSPLRPGDVLEELLPDASPGSLHIAKYIGFEKAVWFVPETRPENQVISSTEASF